MNILKVLGFIFSWFIPFIVVYINHVYLADAGFDVDMFGLLFVIALLFGLMKYINDKCKVWEIQNVHSMFRLNWSNGKKIILTVILTWGLYTIEDNLPKMQWTAVLISACFITGWVLSLLGNIRYNNKKKNLS